MENFEFPTTAKALGQRFNATIVGDEKAEVSSLAPINEAGEGVLSFFMSKKHSVHLKKIPKAVLFTKQELVQPDLPLTYLVVEDPQAVFSQVASYFRPYRHWIGISDMAIIHTEVEIEQRASIGPYAVIGKGARIGKGSTVGAFSYVGANVEMGEDCEIYPRVTLMDGITLGNRVKVYSGAVIGSDGFGFFPQEQGSSSLQEMPQIGTVVLEDDVRVGANTTIDRATIGETRIGQGTKIDNQVHVGHNGKIGKNCVLCGQVGLAGSVTLEDEVMLGGQVGISDNITLGKGAIIGAQSGTWTSLEGGKTYSLTPALPVKHAFKVMKFMRRLPEFLQRIKKIEAWMEREREREKEK